MTTTMPKRISAVEIANHNVSRALLAAALIFAPMTTFAYTQSLNELSKMIVGYFNQAIYVILGLAILVFVWNVYQYFFKADPENKKEAGLYVMYSVIGFFVIIAFWGLVNIVSNTLNLNTNAPSLNFFGSSINPGSGSSGSSNPSQVNTTFSNPSQVNTSNSNPPQVNTSNSHVNPSSSSPLPDQTCTSGDTTC